jgi:spermidine/putrescine ABC transporter ATP-binding subunit
LADVVLDDIWRRYGDVAALHPTSLTVGEGEFLTLLGPSGCGKTTLLRMIAGFVEPSGGRIRVDGQDITDLPPHRRNIGMVFQDYALFPHLTVAQNIGFGLRERGARRAQIAQRVEALMAMIQLEGFANRLPSELSGGQQQRVALARAIAHPPAILLMDEPFAALDVKLREAMQLELRRIHRTLGLTTIFVTHDQAEAMVLSDAIAVMSAGRILQRGEPEALYSRPQSRFVATFLGRMNLIPAQQTGADAQGAIYVAQGVSLRATVSVSGEVSVGVRPEHLALLAPGGGAQGLNIVEAEVLGSLFQGHLRQVHLRWGDADWMLEARAQDPAPAPGDRVTIGWRPADTVVLPP